MLQLSLTLSDVGKLGLCSNCSLDLPTGQTDILNTREWANMNVSAVNLGMPGRRSKFFSPTACGQIWSAWKGPVNSLSHSRRSRLSCYLQPCDRNHIVPCDGQHSETHHIGHTHTHHTRQSCRAKKNHSQHVTGHYISRSMCCCSWHVPRWYPLASPVARRVPCVNKSPNRAQPIVLTA
jgi:hypothetical protein